jgi:hypothetical protein
MDAAQVQHKLFPLSPVTLPEFKSSSRVSVSSEAVDLQKNRKLLWRVMAEELNEEQVSLQRRHLFVARVHNLTSMLMFLISRVFASRYATFSISPLTSTLLLALIEKSKSFSKAGARATSCPKHPRAGGCCVGAI